MNEAQSTAPKGHLYLVGTGCGDFDNITLRALKTIQGADLVVTMHRSDDPQLLDLLKGKEVLEGTLAVFGDNGMMRAARGMGRSDKVPPDGGSMKLPGVSGPMSDADVEQAKARIGNAIRKAVGEGKIVAILDGGDPTIFGPQAFNLREFADLDPVVIPGLSCLSAAGAALRTSTVGGGNGNRSLTLESAPRGCSGDEGPTALGNDYPRVLFTMRSDFAYSISWLRERMPDETPVAVVCRAGYADTQKILRTTLGRATEEIDAATLPFEHLIYVGSFLDKSF